MLKNNHSNYLLHLSTFPPRECGIATFTKDLTAAFDKHFNPATRARVAALNETQTSFYNYPKRVIDSIAANNLESYVELAERINGNNEIKIVNIQHEFGLFGGEWGDYLIPFLQVIKKPVVVTFHSVLPDPDDRLKHTVRLICDKAKAVVVMNDRSRDLLNTAYGIQKSKLFLIPHGIPSTIFEPSKKYKEELDLGDRIVLSTFGLLSINKGVEYTIRALPSVVKKFPGVIYLIVGATHPLILKHEGESYRSFLQTEVERLKLKNHVRFYNQYIPIEEVVHYLKATDIYISTPIEPQQSVSGTLSYALGCGRAAISTPTEYAKHLINEQNGVLVKFKSPRSVSKALLELLEDDKYLRSLHQGAYESTRHMTWPNVARAYFNLYKRCADLDKEEKKLPELKLDHLVRLTDDFGILHHARYSKPEKRFGYSLDDNARALIASAAYFEIDPDPGIAELMKKYLRFIGFVKRPDGSFANIISFKRAINRDFDQDAQGRAIWALGYVASQSWLPPDIVAEAGKLFDDALKNINRLIHPRAIAFAMTGLYYKLKSSSGWSLKRVFRKMADRQMKFYEENISPDWQWFEDHLSYSNSKLPESLFYAYEITGDKRYLETAENSFDFLKRITFGPNYYMPIGQNGWYYRYKKRAYYDQQPEDAASMVQAKIAAYKATKDKRHLEDAYIAFQWFLGKNHLNQMVYDEVTGGCHDGVDKYAMNLNQGAESTISYFLARLAFEDPAVKQIIRHES